MSSKVIHWAYLFNQESHRESFVEQPQFTLLALLVIGIAKNTPVEQCPVHVSNHGSDVTRAIRTLWRVGILDGFQICHDRRVEIHGISLVEGVNLAPRGDFDLGTFRSNVATQIRFLTLG
jgi:hypothetical protein